ncbi:hypothetical protein INS49_009132 [Diaporthe citri]|uniref:uncharacterized protein n=1 Tax=Diaporthe citri TaxID=83186 RepID=UPI001C823128|nr:uncharacterized protein INS49_009132 [Diaporthe citri]KAG6364029.1 hypothetical protein INS49_009132 [Diaporthe citri]
MSTEQPRETQDVEASDPVGPAQPGQVDENSEPSLAIGHDVFRNRQRLLERRRLTNIVLGALAVCLLVSTVTLAILYGKLLRHSHNLVEPVVATTTVTVHHTSQRTTTYSLPTPTTTTSTSSAVATNLLPQIEVTTVTASTTNIAISPATPQPTQCWPGSVWGGADLRNVNEGYAVLMGDALNRSGLGRKELVTDYDLVALRSIFLCGQAMEPGGHDTL